VITGSAPGLLLVLALPACLERITDSPPELDPRFYQSGAQPAGQGSGSETLVPFAAYEGPRVKVQGRIRSDKILPVDLDLWKVDPRSPGNREHLGKIPLTLPGDFTLEVPQDLGGLQVEAFHDLAADGPTNDDPFGAAMLQVAAADLSGVDITLVPGARGQTTTPSGGANGPVHAEAPPGAPGGPQVPGANPGSPPPGSPPPDGSPQPTGGPAAPPDPFAGNTGARVTLRGTLVYADPAATIDIDVFKTDPQGPGGRAFVGKYKEIAGYFELKLPVSLGQVTLEAFIDKAGDGPTPGDPLAVCPFNPVDLGRGDQDGIRFALQ